ncbi:DNA polymerase III subunit [Thermodesulfovibrio sp. TK110]
MGFNEIISQQKAVKLLKGTLRTKKIPSALLFLGDAYIGKTKAAIVYAKALNCLNSEEDACDMCTSCKKIEQGVHPDIKIVAPEKDIITVNSIREVEEFVSFRPLEGRYKVVIIKEAHKMNHAAANAFLKTVEEPPVNTVIILICENIYNLPEPLISRCFKIYFTPLSDQAVKKILPHIEDSLIRIIMGKPGLLISMDILKEIKWFNTTLKSMKEKNKKSLWKDNEDVKWWIDFLCIFLRDCLVGFFLKTPYCPILPSDFKLKENVSIEELFNLYEEVQNIKKSIDLNLNKSIVWNYMVCMLNNLITANKQKTEFEQ